jgi:UDP:flavonoid glycosyltransferase YjiC (YdhE family)
VVVCHSGNGTVYQALSGGTPIVGVPEFHDQDFNMQRVEALGLGRRADASGGLVEGVVSGVEAVLDDPECAARAGRMAAGLRAGDGARAAAGAVAELAGLPAGEPELVVTGRA